MRAGYIPVGVIARTYVLYQSVSPWIPPKLSSNDNRECRDYTKAVQQARRTLLQHVSEEAKRLSADGVLGLNMDTHIELPKKSSAADAEAIVEIHVVGTAIRAYAEKHPEIVFSAPLK
jgi:uncharacterized protein YbjQ (UPF0145 family)